MFPVLMWECKITLESNWKDESDEGFFFFFLPCNKDYGGYSP